MRLMLGALALAAALSGAGGALGATRTPIHHVIVIIGDTRSFDSLFGTYLPPRGQTIGNLLSRGIVNPDGSPGPNAAAAAQFAVGPPLPPQYFISPPRKSAYSTLPAPQLNGAANVTT